MIADCIIHFSQKRYFFEMMEKAKINGNDLEYTIHGDKNGEWVVLIQGSVFADMFLPMISAPSL